MRGWRDGKIDDKDEGMVELRKRNLFYFANSGSFAPDLTRRMVRHGKVQGLLDFLENPQNSLHYTPGKPEYYFQYTGFQPIELQFALRLGDAIGCAEPVQKAIDTYVKWFKDMWQERLNKDKEGNNPYLDDKRKLIYSYDQLRAFDNHPVNQRLQNNKMFENFKRFFVNPWPLNDGDNTYIGILANVNDEQLKEYGRKYLPHSPQASMSTS